MPLENKIHIYAPPCNILSLSLYIYIYAYASTRLKFNGTLVFFPDLLRMISASQLRFALLLVAQLAHSSSHHNGTEGEHSVSEGLSDGTRCSWNCRVIESNFTKQCDPVFTNKRFINFFAEYPMMMDKKCLRKVAIGSVSAHLYVWRPANATISSFSRGIKGVWNLIFGERCIEKGQMKVFCTLKPIRIVVPDSQIVQEVKKSIEEMGLAFIIDKEQPGKLLTDIFAIIFCLIIQACVCYLPTLLCIFSPTVDRENGIPYILLHGAGPVSLRGFLGNKLFTMDRSILHLTSRCHKAKMLFFRVVFMAIPFLLLAPALFVANMTRPYNNFNLTHPFVVICIICYFLRVVYSSLFSIIPHAPAEERPCHFCRQLSSNPSSCVAILPRRIISHMRLQPLIVVECLKSFVRGAQKYFRIIIGIWKGSTSWVICVPSVTILLLVVPFAIALLLLAYLTKCLFFFYYTCPLSIAFQENLLYIGPMRFWKEVKRCISNVGIRGILSNLGIREIVRLLFMIVGLCLTAPGAIFLGLFVSLGILLTFFLAFTMILLFPEQSLPIVACILLICYYFWSIYNSFANKYHDLSLIIFDFYKSEKDQISNEELELCTEGSNNSRSTGDRDIVLKIPKDLFDMVCEELWPVKEAVCLLLLKVILISIFIFLIFYLSMKLDIDVRPLAKTVLAFVMGLIPKIILAYFDGNRRKRIEILAVKETAPKIIQKYLKRFNGGQSNLGADHLEASLAIQENEKNIEIHIERQHDSSTDS